MTTVSNEPFVDFTVSDLIGLYATNRQQRHVEKLAQIENAGVRQEAAMLPEGTSASESRAIGNSDSGAAANVSYWQRIPKGLLFGSSIVLGLAVLLKMAKG